jgi:hypothetical protein
MKGAQRVNPAVLHPLKEALTLAFWYKPDLRAFLNQCVGDRSLVASLDWSDRKRVVVGQLVDMLAADQHLHFDKLLTLLLATSDISDPSHLRQVDDGAAKYAAAVDALKSLRDQVAPYRRIREKEAEAEQHRELQKAQAEMRQAMVRKLADLRAQFFSIVGLAPQPRGYALEKLLNELFAVYDIDAKGPFRNRGEQIDGAFTFDGTEFLLEAKWEHGKTSTEDLTIFAGKVTRKLDNTLGLFISMNGFQDNAITLQAQSRPVMVLMDGMDLMALLEDRIDLAVMLTRKRQHAARTGEVFLPAAKMLGS